MSRMQSAVGQTRVNRWMRPELMQRGSLVPACRDVGIGDSVVSLWRAVAGIPLCGLLCCFGFGCSSEGLACKNGEFYLNGKPFNACSQCSNSTEPCFDVTYEYINDGFVQIVGRETATCHGQTVSMYHGVCQSVVPAGNPGTGGAGISTYPSTGGNTAVGGANGTAPPGCNLVTGVVDGCQVAPSPAIFTISDTCTIGFWAGDQASGGGFDAPWCTGTMAGSTDCTLTLACSGGSVHVSGSYSGSGMGTAAFGIFLQRWSDAGVGCPKMDISGFTGVTIDIDAIAVPNNNIYFGLSLGDGNAAEGTITTVAGTGSIRLPFGSLTNKNKCGSVTGPGVAGIYIAFPWFNDGASHPVDVMFSHIGFYGVGGTGGVTSSSIGGTTSSNGGTTSFYGGTTSAGGTTKAGGTTSAGGITGTGGAVGTGGTSARAGGSSVGAAPATGGLATTGGAISTGGASAAGGASGTSAMTLAQACARNCALATPGTVVSRSGDHIHSVKPGRRPVCRFG